MIISGLQKMTLLDYPGKVACTVFLQGCNFRCPFCHNSPLLGGQAQPLMTTDELLTFLRRRSGLLDAVCVSGGEPTLSPELGELLKAIKALGFLTKLDTNGSRPDVLRALCARGLVDYVAMDVKNSPSRYAQTTGVPALSLDGVEESLRFLMTGGAPYELRTTVVSELHTEASIEEMGLWLSTVAAPAKPARLFLQCFVDRDGVLSPGLHAPSQQTLEHYAQLLRPYVETVAIRGE